MHPVLFLESFAPASPSLKTDSMLIPQRNLPRYPSLNQHILLFYCTQLFFPPVVIEIAGTAFKIMTQQQQKKKKKTAVISLLVQKMV